MLKFADITFFANCEYTDTDALLAAQHSSHNYVPFLKEKTDLRMIKHLSGNAIKVLPRPGYVFFKGRNHFFYMPFAALRYLKKWEPDVVLVQGMQFPFQILLLRLFLKKHVKLLVKNQGDLSPGFLKRLLWKLADPYINIYLFTSYGNAESWVKTGVIRDSSKIHELPVTYTDFVKQDKLECQKKLGWAEGTHYITVGRLNENKDPLTIVAAFSQIASEDPKSYLHIVFQTSELLEKMCNYIGSNPHLQRCVLLHGKVPYTALPVWYSASDFFLSASHSEGGNTALLESMACGCIPVVTAIPSAMKVSCNGKFAFHFPPGDCFGMVRAIRAAATVDRLAFENKMRQYFEKELSLLAVVDQLYRIIVTLTAQ